MHKTLPLLLVLLLFTGGRAQERADVIDSITPASATFFLKTSRINTFIASVSFVADNLLSRERADAFKKGRNDFRESTGVDPLNLESLKNAGVDVERKAAMAIFPRGTRNEERMALFVPVMNEKTFPLAFVEMLKRGAKMKEADLFPAITEYRGHTTHQIGRDIFTAAFEGVFIMASTGELLRKIIDVRADNAGYLALDPLYRESLGRGDGNYDLRVFAGREFLKEALREKKKDGVEKDDSVKKGAGPYTLMRTGAIIMTASGTESLSTGASILNAVDYAFMGASAAPDSLDIDMGVRFNDASATVNTLLDMVKTGMTGRSLRVKDAATYSFLSLDFGKIEELCKKGAPGCRHYARIKEGIREDLGIDLQTDLIPFHGGAMNLIAGQPRGAGGGFLLYVPMDDPAGARKLWEKSGAYLKKKYEGTDRHGMVKVGNRDSFWHIDSKNNRNYMLYDNRGIYLGNDPELIAAALSSPEAGNSGAVDDPIMRRGNNLFFLAHVKKESFIGALLSLYSYRSEDIRPLVEKMTEMMLIGEKSGRYLSLGIDVKLMKRK